MESKNNNLIYGIIIGMLSALVCFFVIYIISTKNTKTEPQNNTPKEQTQQQEQTQQYEKINYEIVENNGSYTLNVNGKNTSIELLDNDLNQIAQLKDIVIAKVCAATCQVYAIDKNANIIASTSESASPITTKGTYITSAKVVDNELYITSQNALTNMDTQSLCEELKSMKDVMFEEKFSYNNGKFNQPTTIKTVSIEEFKNQKNLNCNN